MIITFSVLKFVILDFQNLRFLYELMTSVIDIYPGAILELVFLVFLFFAVHKASIQTKKPDVILLERVY